MKKKLVFLSVASFCLLILIFVILYNTFAVDENRDSYCYDELPRLIEQYSNEDYYSVLQKGEEVINNHTDNDISLYLMLAHSYYKTGERDKAISMLKRSLKSNYICIQPKHKRYINSDFATAYYWLHEIYREINDAKSSENHYKKAVEQLQLFYGEKFNNEILSEYLVRLSIKNKPGQIQQ